MSLTKKSEICGSANMGGRRREEMMTETSRSKTDDAATPAHDRSKSRERRRAAFLDAAEALFIEQGYEGSSLAEIVRRSGGSLSTLYELFGNKQGVLRAIASRWRDETVARRALRQGDKPLSNAEFLAAYVKSECEILHSPHAVALMRILVSECLRDRDFAARMFHDLHLPAIKELSEQFASWTRAGMAAIPDPNATARLFFAIVSGDTMLSTMVGVPDDMPDEAEILWRLEPFFQHFRII